MERNILLTIAYDGSVFHGWQKQPGTRTVQGHLEQVMSRTFSREILLSGTSRTDAGVHALDQKASLKTDIGVPIDKLALVVNNALGASEGSESGRGGFAKAPVRILKAEEMPEDFHARFSCKGKKYIYRIRDGAAASRQAGALIASRQAEVLTENAADDCHKAGIPTDMSLVFERNYVYHVDRKLDEVAMRKAAGFLKGKHDFRSFESSGGNPRETTVRTIFGAEVMRTDSGMLELHISGDGFLYNMVRIITGTLVEIGWGKRKPEEMEEIIEAADRTGAGHTAPPNGLYLAEVYY